MVSLVHCTAFGYQWFSYCSQALRELLKPCVAHVDVILDPYHTSLQWFPYWEGARRMAPQFRSRGIGYLRLGDDMSQYGAAFLSLDAGHTYLDGGATSIVSTSAATPVSSTLTSLRLSRTFSGGSAGIPAGSTPTLTATTGSSKMRLSRALSFERGAMIPEGLSTQADDRENVPGNMAQNGGKSTGKVTPRSPRPGEAAAVTSTGGSLKRSPRGLSPAPINTALRRAASGTSNMKTAAKENAQWEGCVAALRECVHALKNGDGLKWAERVDALQRLACGLGAVSQLPTAESFVSANSTVLSEVVTLVADTLAKQSNPHVLVACLGCVMAMECGAYLAAHCWLAWRGLLLEASHALRGANRMVHEAALQALLHLGDPEVRAVTVAMLCAGGLLEDVVVGVRNSGTAAGITKKGITKAALSAPTPKDGAAAGNGAQGTSGTGSKVSTGANTARVLSWLTTMLSADTEGVVVRCAEAPQVGREGSAGAVSEVSGTVLKCATALLSHREEGTRDAAVDLAVSALASDLLYAAGAKGGMPEMFALSKKLSGEVLKGPHATVKANTGELCVNRTCVDILSNYLVTHISTEAECRLAAVEASLSPVTLSLFGEVRAAYPRFLDRILQHLAQAVSKIALKAAVSTAAKKSAPHTGTAPLSARTVSSEATQALAGSAVVTPRGVVSPRPLPSAAGAKAAASTLSPRADLFARSNPSTGKAALKGDPAVDRPGLVRVDSGLTEASTPPSHYTASCVSAGPGQQTTPLITPRDTPTSASAGFVLASQSCKSHKPLSPGSTSPDSGSPVTIDIDKMHQGLQGIKMMRARSANSTARQAPASEAVEVGAGSGSASASTATSRAGSACRNRRRLLQGPSPGTSSPTEQGSSPDSVGPSRAVSAVLRTPRAADSSVATRVAQELGGMWYEAKLLLRQVPRAQGEWDAVQKVT
jgi:hypothetical protein